MMKRQFIFAFLTLLVVNVFAIKNDSVPVFKIKTTVGDIIVKLYPETPKHRDNFIKLVENKFYNGVIFHRVISNFMIQAGDPKSKTAGPGIPLGSGDIGYTIPAEIIFPKYYHKKGVLAAARQSDDVNPQRASSGAQFYLVKGKPLTDAQLSTFERDRQRKLEKALFKDLIETQKEQLKKYQLQNNQLKIDSINELVMAQTRQLVREKGGYKYTPQQRMEYKTIGGAAHLDNEYTVFGEIIEGINIVDSISNVKCDNNNRPLKDIRILSIKRLE